MSFSAKLFISISAELYFVLSPDFDPVIPALNNMPYKSALSFDATNIVVSPEPLLLPDHSTCDAAPLDDGM